MNTGKKKKINLAPYGYLLPCMAVFAVFLFYPFFKTIYLSLYKTNKMEKQSCLWVLAIIQNCSVLLPFGTA